MPVKSGNRTVSSFIEAKAYAQAWERWKAALKNSDSGKAHRLTAANRGYRLTGAAGTYHTTGLTSRAG